MDYSTRHGILGISEAELAVLQAQVDATTVDMDLEAEGRLWPESLPRHPKHGSPYRARNAKPWQKAWKGEGK